MKSLSLALLLIPSFCLAAEKKTNVLFIAVDDLKPLMSCYGNPIIKTPNIDRLAAQSITYLNAHCQQALCAPSRASLLTGLRPDTTRIYDLQTRIRSITPNVVTLPQYFKQHGYQSIGMGKIFDPRSVDGRALDDPASWSSRYLGTPQNPNATQGYLNPTTIKNLPAPNPNRKRPEPGGGPSTEIDQAVADDAYPDGLLANMAIEQLKKLSSQTQPFFLAVGFRKPHLPFIAPKKYADLYDRSKIPLATYQKMPNGAPSIAYQNSMELRNGYSDIPNLPDNLPDDKQRELIHGYMACVSYIDAQIGKLLDALEKHHLSQNTIVILWGDHGWHLGDHGMWCKHTNYENATRAPLLISCPSTRSKPILYSHPVEFVDIFPTLCELSSLPIPPNLHGKSLVPTISDPSKPIKPYAVSQYPRGNNDRETMGYTFRSDRFRYVRWIPKNNPDKIEEEFYDYQTDPLETKNQIASPEHAKTIEQFRTTAKAFIHYPTP